MYRTERKYYISKFKSLSLKTIASRGFLLQYGGHGDPVHTHLNPFTNLLFFTPTQYGTFIHTPPQHNLSLITHRVIHRLRVLHRHGVSAGASPGSLLASGGAEVVRGLPPCRCKKNEITEP